MGRVILLIIGLLIAIIGIISPQTIEKMEDLYNQNKFNFIRSFQFRLHNHLLGMEV